MNNNNIHFYILANKLKDKIRTGWKELEISSDRLESVAEHIYRCLILAIVINGEYGLELDMCKVLKMLTLHELEEPLWTTTRSKPILQMKKGGNSEKNALPKLRKIY